MNKKEIEGIIKKGIKDYFEIIDERKAKEMEAKKRKELPRLIINSILGIYVVYIMYSMGLLS